MPDKELLQAIEDYRKNGTIQPDYTEEELDFSSVGPKPGTKEYEELIKATSSRASEK